MTNQSNRIESAFAPSIIAKGNNFIVTYQKGLEISLTAKAVNGAKNSTSAFVDTYLQQKNTLRDSFLAVATACHKKGLSRLQAGKVMSIVLGAPNMNKLHGDADVSNRLKVQWQYSCNKVFGEKLKTERKETEKNSDDKPQSMEEMLTNGKHADLGAVIATRVKTIESKLDIIAALLAECTADEIEAVSKMLDVHKAPTTV